MKTAPFRSLLAAIFVATFAVPVPTLAGEKSNDAGSTPATEAKPKKPDKPTPPLKGLHLKLSNVELKVRGPVIIDAGPAETDTSGQGH